MFSSMLFCCLQYSAMYRSVSPRRFDWAGRAGPTMRPASLQAVRYPASKAIHTAIPCWAE